MLKIFKRLEKSIRNSPFFDGVELNLKVFGSAANGFWSGKSDIDFSLVIPHLIKMAPFPILEKVEIAIRKAGICSHLNLIESTRIPIITYKDKKANIECDVNCNNFLGIANSELMRSYAHYDQRFHILGYFVKDWAKNNKVSGGPNGYLTSYAYLNMLIFFLQNRSPPVLPKLQKIVKPGETNTKPIFYPIPDFHEKITDGRNKRVFLENMKIKLIETDIYFMKDLKFVKKWMMDEYKEINKESVPVLAAGFFHYFGYEFDETNKIISIKEGKLLPKGEKGDKYAYSIEDPFDIYHNPGKTVILNCSQHKTIKLSFQNAYLDLIQNFQGWKI